MRKIFGLSALALMAGSLLTCSLTFAPPGKRYALVYGVTTYTTNPSYVGKPNLSYPDEDAVSVGQMLAGKGYDEVRVRIRNETIDDSPTKANLIADMAYFASIIGPNDTFVYYFSGHGGNSGTDYFFVPYLGIDDSALPSYSVILANCVNQNELGTYLETVPTVRKIVILDSCYSGGFVGNPLEVDLTPPGYIRVTQGITPGVISQAIQNYMNFSSTTGSGISPYGNAIVISAAGSNEYSWDSGTFPHGVATYYFLEAPQSGDLNGDGLVTAMEAFALIKAGLDQNWNPWAYINPDINPENPTPGYHDTFAPHISGGPLDYVIF
jgi:hypothetical protein